MEKLKTFKEQEGWHRFTVEGSGEFPFDMLRRENAWPDRTEDALKLTQPGRRQITICASTARFCVPKRWESFGWKIIDGFVTVHGDHWASWKDSVDDTVLA
jgi:hypothetical protein